jgi:hypothetical protein
VPTDRGRRLRLVWAALVLLGLALAGWALAGRWGQVSAALARLSPATLVTAGLLSVASATGSRWRLSRIFYVGQLGKYLPGPGWPMLLQGGLGSTEQQPVRATAGAGVLCAALAPVVGVPLGLLLVLAGAPGEAGRLAWLALPVLPLLALLHPAVFGRAVDGALRLARRRPVGVRVPARALSRAALAQGALWLVVGAQTAVLVRGSGGSPRVALLGAGAAVIAYCAGMMTVVLPAGLGVREGVLALALTPSLGAGPALAVTLSSRALLICTDLLLAGLTVSRRRSRPGRPDPVPAGRAGPDRPPGDDAEPVHAAARPVPARHRAA